MKIRERLTWTLSITAIIATTILGLVVYFFTARFHEREFFSRLEERVAITELIFLEKDREFEQVVRDKFLQTLDREEEYVITLEPSGLDSLHNLFHPDLPERIRGQEIVRFRQGDRQGVGKLYHLPFGDYAVVVTAVDVFGRTKLNFLKQMLFIGGLITALVLVVAGRIGISRSLKPLENKIHRASRISADRLDLRLQVNNPDDEIGEVAIAFNRMLDRLQGSFEAQRAFVRNASHEMRNPLTAISGQLEVLLGKDRSAEEYRTALPVIQREADRLQVLIHQLLDLEKTEALSDLPDPEWFSLDQCLLESTESFSSGRLQLDFEGRGGENLLFGNPHLIRTAIQNLIDNALKYSEDEPVTVSLSREEDHHIIKVIDRGIGIPEEDLHLVFQPLFRSPNARGRTGHGIGLALVKKIVALHEGDLDLRSAPGQGTTFIIRLPAP